MKYLCLIIIILFACTDSSTKRNSSSSYTPTPKKENKWYEGGTLHKAKISDWRYATNENKLATCSDFVVGAKRAKNLDEAYVQAVELVACINEAIKDLPSLDTEDVANIASLCMVLLDNKK